MEEPNSTSSPPNSMLVPLRPACDGDGWSNNTQLALVPPTNSITTTSSRFKPPPGWGVEEVLRSNGSHVDRYYYEPGTGRKFRSSREVERHLNGEQYTPRSRRKLTLHNHNSRCRRMIVSGGKMLKLGNEIDRNQLAIVVSRRTKASPYFKLPDGWIVEKVPRKFNGSIDKYYYEPETGQKFRSLVSVERYLEELVEDDVPLSKALAEIKENKLMSKVSQLGNHIENSVPRTNNISGDNMQVSSIIGRPMKVNWVLASPSGDAWNPMISDMSVPDSVKQQWTKTFMRLMNDGSLDSPNSCA
ncbi:Methyl-CpG-binding domain-containing protein 7 [Abeliophyllum distichum]|uniref:Methyl-CpG-binding domain-containing protein 7 n=1 Tax=Abeliophyllum distichum TaxID=126358 RepID=A0ABD1Q2N2_9LAMI